MKTTETRDDDNGRRGKPPKKAQEERRRQRKSTLFFVHCGSSTTILFPFFCSLFFIIPFLSALSEEIFFRAFLQMRMAKYGQSFAIVASSLLFGIAHLSYGNLLQIAVPFAFGIVLGCLMVKNENIVAPFSAHFTFNFIQLAAAFFFY